MPNMFMTGFVFLGQQRLIIWVLVLRPGVSVTDALQRTVIFHTTVLLIFVFKCWHIIYIYKLYIIYITYMGSTIPKGLGEPEWRCSMAYGGGGTPPVQRPVRPIAAATRVSWALIHTFGFLSHISSWIWARLCGQLCYTSMFPRPLRRRPEDGQ